MSLSPLLDFHCNTGHILDCDVLARVLGPQVELGVAGS